MKTTNEKLKFHELRSSECSEFKPANLLHPKHDQNKQCTIVYFDNIKEIAGDLCSNTSAATNQLDRFNTEYLNSTGNFSNYRKSLKINNNELSRHLSYQGDVKSILNFRNLETLPKCFQSDTVEFQINEANNYSPTNIFRNQSLAATSSGKAYNQKLGHRRVNESGVVSYKHCPVSELSEALKVGIKCSIKSLQPDDISRDVLLQDFNQISVQEFPAIGTKNTPVHDYRDFTFKAYAPVAFQHFRSKFHIKLEDYLTSLCRHDWYELPNAGASGSIFYVTYDDKFIIKTVDAKEANFLLSLLPGYYMNLVQNPETMLPKFFGFYCYQRTDKNIRVVVMNNLVPSNAHVTERYDLKGSRYKRKANENERLKQVPTLKDLDFLENYPNGILLESFVYDTIINILKRDLRVLRSFEIMDYSLLIAICASNRTNVSLHSSPNLSTTNDDNYSICDTLNSTILHENVIDKSKISPTNSNFGSDCSLTKYDNLRRNFKYKCGLSDQYGQFESNDNESSADVHSACMKNVVKPSSYQTNTVNIDDNDLVKFSSSSTQRRQFRTTSEHGNSRINPKLYQLKRSRSTNHRKTQNNDRTNLEENNLFLGSSNFDEFSEHKARKNSVVSADCSLPSTSINCWTQNGNNICIFIGIIDILQHYRLQKRLEHILRTSVLAHKEISVCDPQYYSTRFINFISTKVFRKAFCPLTKQYNDGLVDTKLPSLLSFGVDPTIYSENVSTTSSVARSSIPCISSETPSSIKRWFKRQPNKKRSWTRSRTNNTSSITSYVEAGDKVDYDSLKALPSTSDNFKPPIGNSSKFQIKKAKDSNRNKVHCKMSLNDGLRGFTGSCADTCSSSVSFSTFNKSYTEAKLETAFPICRVQDTIR